MKIRHDLTIELDIAIVPTPDLEDPATLADLKARAMRIAEAHIDGEHAKLEKAARQARLQREGKVK